MVMTVVRGLNGPGCAVLEGRLHIALQLGKSALRGAQVAGAEGLAKSGEIVLKRVVAATRWLPIRGLAARVIALLKLLQRRVRLLGSGEISGLERTGELFEILHPLMHEAAPIGLGETGIGRDAGNGHD